MTPIAILTAHCMALVGSGAPIEAKCLPVIERQLYQLVVQAVGEINHCVRVVTNGEIDSKDRYCLTASKKK